MNAASSHPAPQRLPTLVSLLLFIALCASISYWVLQWLAPAPRPVAAPVASEHVMPPASVAANLFGGTARGAGLLNVQLRGIIHAGSTTGSAAIMSVDGNAPKFYRVNAELMPGVTVKAIHARTVVLSERGAERELPLPVFAAQEGSTGSAPLRAAPEQNPPQAPPAAPAMQQQQPQQQPVPPQSQQQIPMQGQVQAQAQSQLQPGQGATQSSGPSTAGDAASGAEEPAQQNLRNARNTRRPRYRDD